MASQTLMLEGHLLDSHLLSKVLDLIEAQGGCAKLERIELGMRRQDLSRAWVEVTASRQSALDGLLANLRPLGCEAVEETKKGDLVLAPAPLAGCFPANFYATSNRLTEVYIQGRWLAVTPSGMDCAIRVSLRDLTAESVKMWQAKKGDLIVVGGRGVRVAPSAALEPGSGEFGFMDSSVSSEKPKAIAIRRLAQRMKEIREKNQGSIVWVAGPALVHTGAREEAAWLIREGWIHRLLAGNALAAHDIEAELYGSSLGVFLASGKAQRHGHRNHLYAINEIRRLGGIKAAVEQGVIQSGIFFEAIQKPIPFVLAGSIRDDGPLPEVITDALEAQKAMRQELQGAALVIMVSTLLHSIAVGNLLPEGVETWAVDINPAALTKLADRGTHHAQGLVMDAKSFMVALLQALRE